MYTVPTVQAEVRTVIKFQKLKFNVKLRHGTAKGEGNGKSLALGMLAGPAAPPRPPRACCPPKDRRPAPPEKITPESRGSGPPLMILSQTLIVPKTH